MDLDRAALCFSLAARDLVVAVAARESFARHLTDIARRRASRYADPAAAPSGPAYWTDLAAALAPVLPSELMPLWGLIDDGVTLEGGAKGLRSLFSATPSEKERRRVQRTATLAARVLAVAAGADGAAPEDEKRLGDMAMASFGLSADELTAARADAPARASQLEVFGELPGSVRRELVRGAWQVAAQGAAREAVDDELLTVAAKLEVSAELGAIRAEVAHANARCARVAGLAVELMLASLAALPAEAKAPCFEHLVLAAAPPSAAASLRTRASAGEPGAPERFASLVAAQRAQAVALAWASARSLNLAASTEAVARGALRAAAADLDAAAESVAAMELVDRYLNERVAEAALRPAAP